MYSYNYLYKISWFNCWLLSNMDKPYLSISTLKIIYHSLFHSIMSYDIMFWGNSSHSSVIFKIHKRVIRILMGYGYRKSCRELFKELKILTHSPQYVFSLLLFVVNNRDHFDSNSVYHNINTRWKNDLHLAQLSLAVYQKEVYYSGIKEEELSKMLSQMYIGLHVKYRLLLSDFNGFSWQCFEKHSNIKFQWEPNCCLWTEGRKDMMKRRVAFCKLAKSALKINVPRSQRDSNWNIRQRKATVTMKSTGCR